MTKYKKVLILVALLLAAHEQSSAEESIVPKDFPLGERLFYKIKWLRISVGYGQIWVKEKTKLNGRDVFHIVGRIDSNKVLSKIFPIHDEIHGWVDTRTFEAIQFEKKIDELFLDTHERMVYDASQKKGYFESLETGKKNIFPLTLPVHDFISSFYWVRRQHLIPGGSAKMTLTCDQKDWALTINVLKKETVLLNGQKIDTLLVEPMTFVEGEEKRGRAWMNLTNDAQRIPVRIIYKAPFGSVVGTLMPPE